MLQKYLIICLVLLLSKYNFAQSKIEIGIEGGVNNDKYTMDDPKDNLKTIACIGGNGGLSIRYNSERHFFYEAALLFKASSFGYGFKGKEFNSYTGGNQFLSLPFRAGYYLKLSDKFIISPIAGIVPSYIISYASTGGEVDFLGGGTTYQSNYAPRNLNKRFTAFVQTGISFDLLSVRRLRISINPNYYWGTNKITIYDIDYTVSNNPGSVKAAMNDYGSCFNFNFGVKYLLPQKKK
jgi:Outer membrane protein beta-barrel domain